MCSLRIQEAGKGGSLQVQSQSPLQIKFRILNRINCHSCQCCVLCCRYTTTSDSKHKKAYIIWNVHHMKCWFFNMCKFLFLLELKDKAFKCQFVRNIFFLKKGVRICSPVLIKPGLQKFFHLDLTALTYNPIFKI